MTAAVIALSILSLLCIAFCAYLLRDRARARRATQHELDQARAAVAAAEQKAETLRDEVSRLEVEAAQLRERIDSLNRAREQYEEQLEKRLAEQRRQFKESFDASAAETLNKTTEAFFKRAAEHFETKTKAVDDLVKPITETLKKTDLKLGEIEKQRIESATRIFEQIEHVTQANKSLRDETHKLVNALRKPHVRGSYGEVQLQRVAELAGMTSYCDFSTQHAARDADGRLLRPDMVVRLPNGRTIAVDAKTNIEAYINALETDDTEEQQRHLDRFARHVREQAEQLAAKNYWAHFDGSPEFVVMFIPGDQFIDAALEREPRLLDLAAQRNVLLASPSTLIGLLRAVAVGWREHELSESAQELFELGRELHDRAATALGYAADVGKAIDNAADKYNRFVGSVDRRLMPTIRKFEDKGAKSEKTIEELRQVEGSSRRIESLPEPAEGQLP